MKHCMLYNPLCPNESQYTFYRSLLKSTDLINLENACEYFVSNSLLLVGQVPSLDFISCCNVFLWYSNILQSYIKCSDDCAPSSQGHIGLFINPSAWGHLNPSSYCDV